MAGASQDAFPTGGAARAAGSRWRSRWLVLLLALPYSVAAIVLLARQADLPGLLHDDGVYVAMARGIEQGLGPVDTHLGADARTARFPPLYPTLLAASRSLLGVGADGVAASHRWVALNGLLLGVAFAAFLHWLLVWRRLAALLAVGVALCGFTLPTLIGVAQHCMSECLFLALLCIALWLQERALPPAQGRRLVVAALVAGLLPATRTIGAAAVVAFALQHLLVARRLRPAATFLAIAALPWLAATAWSASASAGAIASPLFGPPYRQLLQDHLGDLPRIVAVNAVRCADWLAYALAPRWPLADGSSGGAALLRLLPAALLVGTTVATIGRWRSRRDVSVDAGVGTGPSVVALLAVATLAVLLPWPFPDLRFMLPLAPFALLAFAQRFEAALARFVSPRAARIGPPAALLALLAWNAPFTRDVVLAADRQAGSAGFFGQSLPIAAFDRATDELIRRAAATPDAAVACTLDSLVSLQTGLRGASAWRNDQPYEESYALGFAAWRRLWYAPLPDEAAQRRMFAGADVVLDEYRRLGVRWLLFPRIPGAGMPSHHLLLDRLLQHDRAAAAAGARPRFLPAWRSPEGAFEMWEVAP